MLRKKEMPRKILLNCRMSGIKGTSKQRSAKEAIRKRFPLQKRRWEKSKGPVTVVMGVIMLAASDFEKNKFWSNAFVFVYMFAISP